MAYYPRLRDMREDHDLTQQKLENILACLNRSISATNRACGTFPPTF